MEKIIGLIDAPFTPFYENGEVNYEPIEAYCQLLVKNGLQGVFINGSSGEGYMLTEDERMKLAERWMEVAPQGFKVIVHVGSTCVKSSKRLAEHAQKIGAWGIGAMAPPFPKVGRIEELVKYCEEIACGAPELPFYFYHIPAFNGAFLSMVAFLEAVDGRIPNFAGIKYTFESMYEYNQCRLYKNGKFDMLHGQDETILPCLAMGGAQGGIGGTTNYNGKELVGIIEAWKAGDLELARERQNFAQEVINVICHYRGNIVGGKRIMKLIGLDLGKNRTPFQNMTDEEEAAMKKELEAMLVGMLAGRAAEEIVFDTVTTGASNDIEKATQVARAMITQYGMSEKFGLIGLESVQNRYLNGRPVSNCGAETESEIDKEVMKMLKEAYEQAKTLLQAHRETLDKIAAFLIEKETITGKEFMQILHEVEGADPEEKKASGEERIAMKEV